MRTIAVLAVAAALLSVERATYVAIARRPGWFCSVSARLGEPVVVVAWLFSAFKLLQADVFVAWCVSHGPLVPPPAPLAARLLVWRWDSRRHAGGRRPFRASVTRNGASRRQT